MVPTTLYRFYDRDGGLIYAGITSVGLYRWLAHERDKTWWGEIADVRLEHYPDRESALAAEAAAILNEKPRYNIAGRVPARPIKRGLMRRHGSGSVYQRTGKGWFALAPNSMGRRSWAFKTREAAEAFMAAYVAAKRDAEVWRTLRRVLNEEQA